MKRNLIYSIIALLTLISGCTTYLRNKQLEMVAKDWALVIRASQVIPVYPLSEDLQPGDVLLVSSPIEEQVAVYKEKGFLPLDQLLVRLYSKDFIANYNPQYEVSKDFANFYNLRYGITDDTIPPANWQNPNGDDRHNWQISPRSAFPTYQFSARTGTGLNLAIPIQGVPLALGLMNSGSASGTVTIADANTYGLDNVRLERMVREWARQNRLLLRNYTPREEQCHFLRIVSRVYVTGRVSVTVNNDDSTGAEAAAGADRPVKLIGVTEGDTKENYVSAIEAINKLVTEQLPGARINIATASSRSVTFTEQFERPLVIGYVGFDMPILRGGRLGAPISTLAQLTGLAPITTYLVGNVYRLAAFAQLNQALKNISGNEADRIRAKLDKLDTLLPDRYPFSLYEIKLQNTHDDKFQITIKRDIEIVEGAEVKRQGFESVLDYLGNAHTTVENIASYLPTAPRETEAQRKNVSLLSREYEYARAALEDIQGQLNQEPVLMEAIDFVFLGI